MLLLYRLFTQRWQDAVSRLSAARNGTSIMIKRRAYGEAIGDTLSTNTRTRRARLTAEFELELGIDHVARAKAAADYAQWLRLKAIIIWTVALIFFVIALLKMWEISKLNEIPFSGTHIELPAWMDNRSTNF